MGYKISVIIPVFNAEKYISECIESLLSQTLRECEFIFVNDGSSDKSKKIIEKYMESDERIALIDQANKGVSAARNRGLSIARGEYIGFVDADDFVKVEMYETLYNLALINHCDIIMSDFQSFGASNNFRTFFPFPIKERKNSDYIQSVVLPYFLHSNECNSVCNKIYKSEIIRTYGVQFPQGIALGEDGLFNIKFLRFAKSFMYIDYIGYLYREVEGSATRNLIRNDYFIRAIEEYNCSITEKYIANISKEEQLIYKSIKLIKNVMSYIHIYLNPSNNLSISKRYSYICNMINHKSVIESVPIFNERFQNDIGRYEKLLLKLILKKSVFGLMAATAYSRFRNKQ